MQDWIHIFWPPIVAVSAVAATFIAIILEAREQHRRPLKKRIAAYSETHPAWRVKIDRLHKDPPLE